MKILTKLSLMMAGGFLGSLLIFLFLVRPNLNEAQALNRAASTKQGQLNALVEQISAYKESQSDLKNLTDKDTVLDSVLPKEDLQAAIEEIEAAAAKSGTQEGLVINEQTDTTNQTPPTPLVAGETDVSEVPYTINVNGNYNSLLTFLEYLEHLPHFTEVSKITFFSDVAGSNQGALAVHNGIIQGEIDGVFFIKNPNP